MDKEKSRYMKNYSEGDRMTTDEKRDYLAKIPVLKQRQDSVSEQLADLCMVANKLGMYDAADAISQLFDTKGLESLRYGCRCDKDGRQI